jgi:hypothetical protein
MTDLSNSLDRLHAEARQLRALSDALQRRYDRTTWFRFLAVVVPIPFVVLLLRLQLEAWHYYLAGGGYMVFALGLFTYDSKRSARCDEALAAAQAAEQAYDLAAERLESP